MFLNGNLNKLMIVILMTFITCPLSKGKNRKSYQMIKIDETYSKYKNREIPPNDELMKMTIKEFYDTVQNVQFIRLPALDVTSFNKYKENISNFCKEDYKPFSVFVVESTLEEYTTQVNILSGKINTIIEEEYIEFQKKKNDMGSIERQRHNQNSAEPLRKTLCNCFNTSSERQTADCIEKELNRTNKLIEFQGYITEFKKNIRSIVSFDFGDLKFSKNMVPIIGKMFDINFRTFNADDVRGTYKAYLGYVDIYNSFEEECNKLIKPFDMEIYTSKKIGYHLFPQTNEESLKVFKKRRIQFVYHLSKLFKEIGIPNDEKFQSLLKSTESIDESYFNKLKSVSTIAKETYESYVIRLTANGYYPLPERLWKSDTNRI